MLDGSKQQKKTSKKIQKHLDFERRTYESKNKNFGEHRDEHCGRGGGIAKYHNTRFYAGAHCVETFVGKCLRRRKHGLKLALGQILETLLHVFVPRMIVRKHWCACVATCPNTLLP